MTEQRSELALGKEPRAQILNFSKESSVQSCSTFDRRLAELMNVNQFMSFDRGSDALQKEADLMDFTSLDEDQVIFDDTELEIPHI